MNEEISRTQTQTRGIRLTVAAIAVFMVIVVASFIHRVQMPRVLTPSEMKINGAYMFETPRNVGNFELIDHKGEAFTTAWFSGGWTLVFFGFTTCPDVCPTTLNDFRQVKQQDQSQNFLIGSQFGIWVRYAALYWQIMDRTYQKRYARHLSSS